MKQFMQFIRDEEGASAIEYALIAGLIAVVIATALSPIGTRLTALFGEILTKLGG
jgi:pilus assembly protein Flp/PilA